MKLAVLLTLVGILDASAAAYSQSDKVTLNVENATIVDVLSKLEGLTDYHFIYSLDLVADKKPVSLNVKKEPLKNVLRSMLSGNGVDYKLLNNRLIVITPKKELASLKRMSVIMHAITVHGTVKDDKGISLTGVTVRVKGTGVGTVTDVNGTFSLDVPELNDTLVFTYVGYITKEVPVGGQTSLDVRLESSSKALKDVVVIGYGTQKKEDLTGAISSVTSEDIEKVHGGSTVSTSLAGKISGLSFRQSEGRPGASAGIQIRNMGTPLYVIDGVVKDEGQFNNIAPNDIASISVLKDASAAIYGVRAANGVVVVTTKRGSLNMPTRVRIDAYTGWQNMFRYPNDVLNAYQWMAAAADAQMNGGGSTNITPEELEKWKKGTEYGYQSFNWRDFIFRKNAPQTSVNVNVSGGSKTTNYYFSVTRLNQDAVFRQYNFNRTNIQSNIDTRIGERLKVGMDINGRIEQRKNPGVPGVDDYWEPLFAVMRNPPTEHPYANNNPEYLNDIGHNNDNAALWTYARSGKWQSDWRVLQTNFHADYDLPVKGLSARAVYSYYYANQYLTNHEFTYDAYIYNPADSSYTPHGGSANPWQERQQDLVTESDLQGQLSYNNSFGQHTIGATFVTEWYQRRTLSNWLHDVPPVNQLDIIRANTIDQYNDHDDEEARIGYIGRLTYNYAGRYYLEASGRYDASWKFAPGKRSGFFPSFSAGWRFTGEPFFKSLTGSGSVLDDAKLRVSYGQLGDDNINEGIPVDDPRYIDPFGYIPGYHFGQGTVILDGEAVTSSRDVGEPITSVSWFISHIFDVGLDFSLGNGKLTGSLDYFYRKRTGLRAPKYDVVVPSELGYTLPDENLNSDAQVGGEVALSYTNKIGGLRYTVSGNMSYSRKRDLQTYKPTWGNSWDHYRNSVEERWAGIFWGYEVTGQFRSQEQINNYPVNIDGFGNKTLLPGDFIYKDANGDGAIDEYDMRPIGYNTAGQPALYGGLSITLGWKGIDFTADFSYAGLYSYNRNWEARWPFQNGGNLLKDYTDRWHREDPFDLNSPWIPGKYPPLRFNDSEHSNYNKNSTWWLINIRQARLRTLELGYTLPGRWTQKVKIEKARIYLNGYDLFSFDNLKKNASFLDPEVSADNGLQYPQSKFVNVGINLTF
ncbi:TonB-dependent receptor [Compostibacter hankyongensis]|uniref:TonB-dependent receptor n=1 Tax=Compostibacter hankyongensis TaxID=1007089 RepID=A0ABP8G370_9BACT